MNSMQANSTFTLIEASEKPFSEFEGGPKLTKGNFKMAYVGELQGESILQELKCYLADGSATVFGFEQFTGSLGDRSGTFVLEHVGKFENGVLTSKRNVVIGSCTGDLIGLKGEVNFQTGSAEQFTITLEYRFE
ncbi:DUF3224 domain-containing protein [Viridibacillus arvi]|uniref:DUF3224 domain-containing protein n=1 Tax=Viridibacillus arvi TaxID=263475 RepID=UPI003D0468FB